MTLRKLLTIVFAGAAAGMLLPATAIADGPAGAAMALERGMPTGTLHVTHPGPALFSGADTVISALGGAAPPGGTLADLSRARKSPYPERLSAAESGSREGLAAAASPPPAVAGTPSGTLALLCGLVVVAFVARRRMG